jgi:hypothetical protein
MLLTLLRRVFPIGSNPLMKIGCIAHDRVAVGILLAGAGLL